MVGPFYDTVAPATPAGLLLRCFDAGRSPETKAWHLLLEDLTDSHRVASKSPLPPTEPHCRAIVGMLARSHAAWWDATPPGVPVGAEPAMTIARDLYRPLPVSGPLSAIAWGIVYRPNGAGSTSASSRRRRTSPDWPRAGTSAFMHGDAHVWNVFLPNDDCAGGERLFDWGDPGLRPPTSPA